MKLRPLYEEKKKRKNGEKNLFTHLDIQYQKRELEFAKCLMGSSLTFFIFLPKRKLYKSSWNLSSWVVCLRVCL